ncbi:hypothetical protein BC828DRAFT_376158 [Blastocladiella britannica]|nr:hypothetical protein BC828DRAFT_376158 [Blastocladiella britannica]
MSTTAVQSEESPEDALRHLSFLHNAVQLYSTTSAPIAAWLGTHLVDRADASKVVLADPIPKQVCVRCGVLILPGLTTAARLVPLPHRKKKKRRLHRVVVWCTRCRARFPSTSTATSAKATAVASPLSTHGRVVRKAKRRLRALAPSPATVPVAAPPPPPQKVVPKAALSPKAPIDAKRARMDSAGMRPRQAQPPSSKKLQQQQQVPPSLSSKAQPKNSNNNNNKANGAAVVMATTDLSRKSINKKKSTLRGLLSLQQRTQEQSSASAPSLADFLSGL